MTLSSTIEDAWKDAIWTDTTITDYTDKIHKFRTTQDSEFEAARYYYKSEINFIEAITTRAVALEQTAKVLGGVASYEFNIEINYYKQIDPDGTTYNDVRDFFETLLSLMITNLGHTWTNTVDFWRPQTQKLDIIESLIDSRRCWRGVYNFTGTKTDSL